MFGNLGNSWTAGLNQFSELGGKLQKIRQDVEQNLETQFGIDSNSKAGASAAGTPIRSLAAIAKESVQERQPFSCFT